MCNAPPPPPIRPPRRRNSASRCRVPTMTDVTPGQAGRHQDPGPQRQRPGRPGRRGGRRTARPGVRRAGCGQRHRLRERPAGSARARSASVRPGAPPPRRCGCVAPCTELFQDQRSDDTVDLAIGTEFTELTHSDDIDAVLAQPAPRRHPGRRSDAADERSTPAPASHVFRCDGAYSLATDAPERSATRRLARLAMPGAAATISPGPRRPARQPQARARLRGDQRTGRPVPDV